MSSCCLRGLTFAICIAQSRCPLPSTVSEVFNYWRWTARHTLMSAPAGLAGRAASCCCVWTEQHRDAITESLHVKSSHPWCFTKCRPHSRGLCKHALSKAGFLFCSFSHPKMELIGFWRETTSPHQLIRLQLDAVSLSRRRASVFPLPALPRVDSLLSLLFKPGPGSLQCGRPKEV